MAHSSSYPLVSLCTPTFNRRPFIPYMIKCFEHQDYPKDRIEWIILDDGTDPIGEMVEHIPCVKYFYYEEKMVLGKKRNLMHEKCSGDIIIYMDDDDYYPPDRISHAVDQLLKNPEYLIAGSSEMHIYYASQQKMYQCGPYGPNHATAATFAFKKELLTNTNYGNEKAMSEERDFTKGYTIPMIQLDSRKSILVFSHQHNTLNKEFLIENAQTTKTIPSKYTVDDFRMSPEMKQFYMYDVNQVLESYDAGKLKYKHAAVQQQLEDFQTRVNNMKAANKQVNVNIQDVIKNFEERLNNKDIIIHKLMTRVKELTEELNKTRVTI
jgi:glycosyltransferase involved in cell wall biosynthesis